MNRNDPIHSLELIFEWNGTSDENRLFWKEKFLNSSTAIKETLLEFFASFPGEIGRFTTLQKKKESIIANHDKGAWKSIMDEEQVYFDSLVQASS